MYMNMVCWFCTAQITSYAAKHSVCCKAQMTLQLFLPTLAVLKQPILWHFSWLPGHKTLTLYSSARLHADDDDWEIPELLWSLKHGKISLASFTHWGFTHDLWCPITSLSKGKSCQMYDACFKGADSQFISTIRCVPGSWGQTFLVDPIWVWVAKKGTPIISRSMLNIFLVIWSHGASILTHKHVERCWKQIPRPICQKPWEHFTRWRRVFHHDRSTGRIGAVDQWRSIDCTFRSNSLLVKTPSHGWFAH